LLQNAGHCITNEDRNQNILYGAKDIYELKQKLKIYEDMKKKQECGKAGILNSTNKKISGTIIAVMGI